MIENELMLFGAEREHIKNNKKDLDTSTFTTTFKHGSVG